MKNRGASIGEGLLLERIRYSDFRVSKDTTKCISQARILINAFVPVFQLDESLIPLEVKGPVATPPIKDFDPPDGDYYDTTKVFDK